MTVGRNAITSIAGKLKSLVEVEKIPSVLSIFNSYLKKPLPYEDIRTICKSIYKHNIAENTPVSSSIVSILQDPMSIKEVVWILQTGGKKVSYRYVQVAIGRLMTAQKISKISRGKYQAFLDINTAGIMDLPNLGKPINYSIPLQITEISDVYPNTIILLASKAGKGKTHVFAYIIKKLLEQGIPCSYWDLENELPAVVHVLNKYVPTHLIQDRKLFEINTNADIDINTLKLSPERVNFIDPLYVTDGWGEVDNTLRRLKKQLKGGLCFVAAHLKNIDGQVFGGETTMKVPGVVMYLTHKNKDRFHPVFNVKKAKHWKNNCFVRKIACSWDDEYGLGEAEYTDDDVDDI